jgi:hypothetical protein
MARRLFFGGVMLLCSLVPSCRDATAPTTGLLITVSPDTVHLGQAVVPPFIRYTERYVSPASSRVWITTPELEMEAAPGQWQTLNDPNNLYLQAAVGDAWAAVTSNDLAADRTFYVPIAPGRYRLRQRFRVTGSNATDVTGDIFVATSNPFIVVTP